MKKLALFALTIVTALTVATPAFAADKEKSADKEAKEKTVTISGEGKCGKCALKETEKCQNVIEAENKKGKKVTYYLVENDISKEFHKNICKESKKVTATGTAKKVDGKMQLTATKIEEVK